jgi:hypothetical protein
MDPGNTMGIHTTIFFRALARSVHVLFALQVPAPYPDHCYCNLDIFPTLLCNHE